MQFLLADLDNPLHAAAVIDLVDMYCRDAFGGSQPLPEEPRGRLIEGLKTARGLCFLAETQEGFVAIALCIPSFSSFRARPVLNIHDMAVRPGSRGQGIGQALLGFVAAEAARLGFSKLTLEVRSDNELAKNAYRRAGFVGTQPETLFWSRELSAKE